MLRSESYTGPLDTAELVDEFLDDCRWRGLRVPTLVGYRWALDRLIAACPELPTTPRELAAALDDAGLAQESRRQLLKVVRLFYAWTGQEYGAPNPSALLGRIPKRRTLPRVLTGEEVRRLVDVAGGVDDGFKHFTGCKVLKTQRGKALVLTALDTGLRLGEIAGLQVADLQDGWLLVNGKTGERQVPVSPEVLDLIWRQVAGDCVWPSTKGGKAHPPRVSSWCCLASSRTPAFSGPAPGQRIGPHCLQAYLRHLVHTSRRQGRRPAGDPGPRQDRDDDAVCHPRGRRRGC